MQSSIKLDKRDKRILFELDRNCRQQLSSLAVRLKLPLETLRYRIQRLVQHGLISNFLTVVDGGRLGFYYYKVFLRLHNVTENDVQDIVGELAANPAICWVVRLDGVYDIGFTPRVTNPLQQSALMDALRVKYARVIQSWTLSVNVKMDFLSRDYLIGATSRGSAAGSYSAHTETYKLDGLEQKILEQLAVNPRASGAEIATLLGTATETVLSRIRRLEKEQVIVRYMTVINNDALQQLNYYVLVYFSKLNPAREEAFLGFCRAHPNVVYFIKSLGPWDYELNIEVPSIEAAREFLMLMTRDFADIIREYHSLLVHEIKKYVYP